MWYIFGVPKNGPLKTCTHSIPYISAINLSLNFNEHGIKIYRQELLYIMQTKGEVDSNYKKKQLF